MICFRNASLPLLFLLVHSFTPAQVVPSGTEIIGTVKDSTGAVVPKVGVQLLSRDGKRIASTSSNNEGAFDFSILKTGEFVVQVRHKGFKTFVAHVPASPGRVKPIAVVLELTRIVWALSNFATLQDYIEGRPYSFTRQQGPAYFVYRQKEVGGSSATL